TQISCNMKALMKNKVVNKHARHNVCFGEEARIADIPNGQGTIIAFNTVPCINYIRTQLPLFLGTKANSLLAEGNKYIDVAVNGIGAHGDTERALVIGVRIGQSFPLQYSLFIKFKPVGKKIKFLLDDGDMYIMSHKKC